MRRGVFPEERRVQEAGGVGVAGNRFRNGLFNSLDPLSAAGRACRRSCSSRREPVCDQMGERYVNACHLAIAACLAANSAVSQALRQTACPIDPASVKPNARVAGLLDPNLFQSLYPSLPYAADDQAGQRQPTALYAASRGSRWATGQPSFAPASRPVLANDLHWSTSFGRSPPSDPQSIQQINSVPVFASQPFQSAVAYQSAPVLTYRYPYRSRSQ